MTEENFHFYITLFWTFCILINDFIYHDFDLKQNRINQNVESIFEWPTKKKLQSQVVFYQTILMWMVNDMDTRSKLRTSLQLNTVLF